MHFTLRKMTKKQRWSLFAGLFMILACGTEKTFNIWANSIKDTFTLTQTQVSVIGSILILGTYSQFIGALILEKFGDLWTGVFNLVLGSISYAAICLLSYHSYTLSRDSNAVSLAICFGTAGNVNQPFFVCNVVNLIRFTINTSNRNWLLIILRIFAYCKTNSALFTHSYINFGKTKA